MTGMSGMGGGNAGGKVRGKGANSKKKKMKISFLPKG
jgi:hypothetical protein